MKLVTKMLKKMRRDYDMTRFKDEYHSLDFAIKTIRQNVHLKIAILKAKSVDDLKQLQLAVGGSKDGTNNFAIVKEISKRHV